MKDVPILAPSAGQNVATAHLHSASLQLGQRLSRLTAQHNAIAGVTVGSKIIHKMQTCPAESPKKEGVGGGRKCEGAALGSQEPVWMGFIQHTLSSFDTHTVTQWPR